MKNPSNKFEILFVAASIGCAAMTNAPNPGLSCPACSLTTDATAYVAKTKSEWKATKRYHFTIITRFENRSSGTVFLGRCNPASTKPLYSFFDADTNRTRKYMMPAYATFGGCVGHDKQFELQPHQVRIDTLLIEGPNAFDKQTGEGVGRLAGAFKLRFDVRTGPGEMSPMVPLADRTSNSFSVRTSQ